MMKKYDDLRVKLNKVVKKLKIDNPKTTAAATEAMKLTIDKMLRSAPEPKDAIYPLFNRLKPLSCEIFERYAAIADPDFDIMDPVNLEFKQKIDSDRVVWTG